MKILFISKFLYPDQIGGIEIHVHKVASELASRGSEVNVLTIAKGCKNPPYFIYRVKLLPYPLSELSFTIKCFLQSVHFDIDVVHVHCAVPSAMILAYYIHLIKHVPFVITFHGSDVRKSPRLLRGLYSFLLRRASSLTCVSLNLKKEMSAKFKITKNTVIIPTGFDDRLLETTQSEDCVRSPKIIAFVGSMRREKDPLTFAQAIAILSKTGLAFKAIMVGEGYLKNELTSYIERNHLNSIIQVFKPMPQERLFEIIKTSDIIAITSIEEGLPTFLIECMALNKIVVTTNVGGIPEVVLNNQNGILISPKSPKVLAEALKKILTHPEITNKMGVAARESVVDFTWNNIARKYEDIYKQVISPERKRR